MRQCGMIFGRDFPQFSTAELDCPCHLDSNDAYNRLGYDDSSHSAKVQAILSDLAEILCSTLRKVKKIPSSIAGNYDMDKVTRPDHFSSCIYPV